MTVGCTFRRLINPWYDNLYHIVHGSQRWSDIVYLTKYCFPISYFLSTVLIFIFFIPDFIYVDFPYWLMVCIFRSIGSYLLLKVKFIFMVLFFLWRFSVPSYIACAYHLFHICLDGTAVLLVHCLCFHNFAQTHVLIFSFIFVLIGLRMLFRY